MPITQTPSRVVPAFCAGTSISVEPVEGRILRYPRLGMVTPEEQSNVPSVFMRSVVGISAFAEVAVGKYPPLTPISTSCLPSATDTLLVEEVATVLLPPPVNSSTPPTIATLRIIAAIVSLFIRLEVKDWLDKTDDNKAIYEVKECEHDDDEPRTLEEDARLRAVLDTK